MGRVPAGRVSGVRCVALVLALLAPSAAQGQMAGTSVELFATAGAVAGFTPVDAESGSHIAGHAGARFDGGFQFPRLGLGVGGRYWEMAPTDEYGGTGVDVFFLGEWRPGNSLRTTFRGTLGSGFDDFDSGHGTSRPTIRTNGFRLVCRRGS